MKCWNEEIIEAMVHDLTPPWEELQRRLGDHGDEIDDSIDDLFGRVDEFLGKFTGPGEPRG